MTSWKTHARWGAIAWGVVAAFEAVVTYLSQAFPPFDLSVVFAVSALVSLLAAVLLARTPSASVLLAATVWAGVNMVLGLWGMPEGGQDLRIPFALLVGAAGLASFLAWRGRRDQA
jgi:hypothetical protein